MITLVFSNNYLIEPLYDAIRIAEMPAGMAVRDFYAKIGGYLLDLGLKSASLEFDDTRGEIFCETDAAYKSEKMIYVRAGNHYSLIERYPDAQRMMIEYHPSLVFAQWLTIGDDQVAPGESEMRMCMHAYCMLLSWLIGKKIPFERHKCDIELGTVDLSRIKTVDVFNKKVCETEFSYWPDEITRKFNVFAMLGVKPMSAREIVTKFSGT